MPIELVQQQDDVVVFRATNTLTPTDMNQAQEHLAVTIKQIGSVRGMIQLEDFSGWEKSEEWSDMSFFNKHDKGIKAIAVVGDPRWKADMLTFLLAGMRQAEVEFFSDEAKARSWLDERVSA